MSALVWNDRSKAWSAASATLAGLSPEKISWRPASCTLPASTGRICTGGAGRRLEVERRRRLAAHEVVADVLGRRR